MSKRPSKKKIGLFVLIGISLFISAVLMFVGGKLFSSDKELVVMYFEESIKGLSIGSPLLFRGVEIGRVTKIDLMANTKDLNFSIPVFANLNTDQDFKINKYKKTANKEKFLKALIEKGLKAKLVTQSYLTGQLMVELEITTNSNKTDFSLYNNGVLEIPTTLSSLSELSKSFKDLPIRQIADKVDILLNKINGELPIILTEMSKVLIRINKILNNNSDEITNIIGNLSKSLENIGQAARSLKNLTDYLERHPEALLKGKKGY